MLVGQGAKRVRDLFKAAKERVNDNVYTLHCALFTLNTTHYTVYSMHTIPTTHYSSLCRPPVSSS